MSQDQSSQLDPSTNVDHPDVASTPLSLKRFIVILGGASSMSLRASHVTLENHFR